MKLPFTMRLTFASLLASTVLGGLPHPSSPPVTEDERASYVVGRQVGQSLVKLHLSAAELRLVQRGLEDAVRGTASAVDLDAFDQKRMERFTAERVAQGIEIEHGRGKAYAERLAREPGARRLPSGIVVQELRAGSGVLPRAADYLRVHVLGRLVDGQVFDDSRARGKPLNLQLHPRFIRCWTEALRSVRVGGRVRAVCPASAAFGDALGRPPLVPPGATVEYELELLEIARDPG